MELLETHAAISLALACVLWTVQLVIYPAFHFIAVESFNQWHRGYTGTITWIVAPLILLQAAGMAGRLVLKRALDPVTLVELALIITAWAVTFFVSVPLHEGLQKKRCERDMRRLVQSNWLRTIAWSGAAALSWLAAKRG